MNEIKPGIFTFETSMPCQPQDIRIYPYLLRSTLGRGEPEEVAARILSFSQKENVWVGISWQCLVEMAEADFKLYMKKEAGEPEVKDQPLPRSLVYIFGPQVIDDGVRDLLKLGMLSLEKVGERENVRDVFFPTPNLLQLLLDKQQVAA